MILSSLTSRASILPRLTLGGLTPLLSRSLATHFSPQIHSVRDSADAVDIVISTDTIGPRRRRFHHAWLRDHCPCPACRHPQTSQRLVSTFDTAVDARPVGLLTVCAAPGEGERFDKEEAARKGHSTALPKDPDALRIEWDDGHESVFSAAWLAENAYDLNDGAGPEETLDRRSRSPEEITWDAQTAPSVEKVTVPYEEASGSEEGLLAWMGNVDTYGYGFVGGCPVDAGKTQALMERIAPLKNTHFGTFWVFKPDMAQDDLAYSNIELGSHHDGTYYADPPYQLFHCLASADEGGETTLVDAFHAAERLRDEDPAAFQLLSTLPIPQRYFGDEQDLVNREPVITCDEDTGRVLKVRFNNDDRATLDLPYHKMMPFYHAYSKFAGIIRDPSMIIEFPLTPGLVLAIDNRRVMHGRREFVGNQRTFSGSYIDQDFWRSKYRYLNDKINKAVK